MGLMNSRCYNVVNFTLLLSLLFSTAKAQLDPAIEWKQMRTEHFLLVYDAKYKSTAESYARYGEQAFKILQPIFEEAPEVTTVLINDNTDQANAYATSLPYPFIHLYPVYPTTSDSVSDHANWAYELIAHEYGHILSFEPSHGIFKPLRYILGSVARPNFFLPRWYHEGVSVNLETLFTKNGGRLKSPSEQGDLRALIEDGTLRKEPLARINEAVPDWLGGRRPYIFGALVILEIIRQKEDPKVLFELTQSYSKRLPYTINGPLEDLVGKTYEDLLSLAYDRLETKAKEQFQSLEQQPISKTQALPQRGYDSHGPRFSRDGKLLAFIGKTDTEYSNIQILKADDALSFQKLKGKTIYKGQRITKLSWLSDSRTLIFDDLTVFKRFYQYTDIFSLDTQTQKSKRLTHGLRAQEPDVSADGQWIVFRQNYENGTRIARVDKNGENYSVLYTPPHAHRVAEPEFVGVERIVFAERDPTGREILRLLVVGNDPVDLLENYAPASHARMTSEGLLFVSAKSGVPNLYLSNGTFNAAKPVTNVRSRTIEGDIHPLSRDLVYSKQTGSGPRIVREKYSQWSLRPSKLPQVGPLIDFKWPEFEFPEVTVDLKEEDYSPGPFLLPRYWIPLIFSTQGGTIFQATTASQDPTMQHSYSLQAQYDTLTTKVSTLGNYTNRTTPITYDLFLGNYYEYFYSGQFTRQNTTGSLLGSWAFNGFQTNWQVSLGMNSSKIETGKYSISRAGPIVAAQYSNIIQRGNDITPQNGGSVSISHNQYLEKFGNRAYGQTVANMSGFLRNHLPERHGLAGFFRGQFAPQLQMKDANLFSTTQNGVYQFSLLSSQFIMRGYLTGVFLGKSIVNSSLEYRFPIKDIYGGSGSWPLFIKRFHGALIMDTLAADGISYNMQSRVWEREEMKRVFVSVGAEIKMDLSLGYMLPAQAFVGLYQGLREPYGGGLTPFFGFLF